MFEDYFFWSEERQITLPFDIYRMMQFIGFSFHDKNRIYSNPINNDSDDDSYGIAYKDRMSDKVIYIDFIDTFKVLFDV